MTSHGQPTLPETKKQGVLTASQTHEPSDEKSEPTLPEDLSHRLADERSKPVVTKDQRQHENPQGGERLAQRLQKPGVKVVDEACATLLDDSSSNE